MFCANCGSELHSMASFCARCGSPVDSRFSQGGPSLGFQNPQVDATRRAEFLNPDIPTVQRPPRAGRFVVSRNTILPPQCVKCGNPATEPWLRKTFYWHHPGFYFLVISPLIYIIVALIVRKSVALSVPLCDAHKKLRITLLWVGGVLLAGCIPLPVVLGSNGDDSAVILAVWLGIAMFIAGIAFLGFSSQLRPTYIDSQVAEFTGACPAFLSALNAAPTSQVEVGR